MTASEGSAVMIVYPSGSARATKACPIPPPAPPLFSTTTFCPNVSDKWAARGRAAKSATPPGGNGTTSVIVRVGHGSCARSRSDPSQTPPEEKGSPSVRFRNCRRFVMASSLLRMGLLPSPQGPRPHCAIGGVRSDTNGGTRIISEAPKDGIAFLSVAELLARYRRKEVSPLELLRAVLDQIDRHNNVVNAYCWVDRDTALRSAKDSEARWMAGAPRGLLDGVPAGIKDNVLVAGMPARFGSKLTSDAPATPDAPAVTRLRDRSAPLIRQATKPRAAPTAPPATPPATATPNPWDTRKTPGGS